MTGITDQVGIAARAVEVIQLSQEAPDGTYNDRNHPRMGAKDTRFGRNTPLGYT